MREKIARALFRFELPETATWETASGLMQNGFLAAADAVLDALREPTEAMTDAGVDEAEEMGEVLANIECARLFSAMIDAAKETQE